MRWFVSLFALTPGHGLAQSATWTGVLGLLFVLASVLAVRRHSRRGHDRTANVRGLTFLIAIFFVFGLQLFFGIRLLENHAGAADNLATLVIVSCLLGIYRAWELIGGPEFGLGHEMRELIRERQADDQADRGD